MFFTFLAQSASSVDPEFIGKFVLTLGAIAAAGLGGGIIGRKSMKVETPNPMHVRNTDTYALKDDVTREFCRIDKDIDDMRQLMRESETAAHRRMDKMTVVLSQVDGKMDLLLGKFNITSKPS